MVETGGKQIVGPGTEVINRVSRLGTGHAALVAQIKDRVGEPGTLFWSVNLLGHKAQLVPATVRIIVSDRIPESLQLRRDQFRELDVQREVDLGEIEQTLPQGVELVWRQGDEVADGVAGESCDMCARELPV